MVVYFELVPEHEYLAKYLTNSTSANLAKCLALLSTYSIIQYSSISASIYEFLHIQMHSGKKSLKIIMRNYSSFTLLTRCLPHVQHTYTCSAFCTVPSLWA